MRACSTAGGAVMFIPDELERKERSQSYRSITESEDKLLVDQKPRILLPNSESANHVPKPQTSFIGKIKKLVAR